MSRRDQPENQRRALLGDVIINVGDAEGVEEGGADASNEIAQEYESETSPVPGGCGALLVPHLSTQALACTG